MHTSWSTFCTKKSLDLGKQLPTFPLQSRDYNLKAHSKVTVLFTFPSMSAKCTYGPLSLGPIPRGRLKSPRDVLIHGFPQDSVFR